MSMTREEERAVFLMRRTINDQDATIEDLHETIRRKERENLKLGEDLMRVMRERDDCLKTVNKG